VTPYTAPVLPDPGRIRRSPVRAAGTAAVLALAGLLAACSSTASDGRVAGFRAIEPSLFPPESSTVESSSPGDTAAPATTAEPASTTTSTTTTSTTTTTTIDPATVAHAYPVDPAVTSSFTPQAHANYRAVDVFASSGCGTRLLSPVTGTVDEVLANVYDRAVDDPATRGGNAVAIVGDDGVRYYMAHFQLVDPTITPGARVEAGQYLGEMGETGRAGACHVHIGLSLPCANGDWWVRRGVIWPDEYLLSWKEGGNLSPLPELRAWFAEYPDACRSVEDTPYPVS